MVGQKKRNGRWALLSSLQSIALAVDFSKGPVVPSEISTWVGKALGISTRIKENRVVQAGQIRLAGRVVIVYTADDHFGANRAQRQGGKSQERLWKYE